MGITARPIGQLKKMLAQDKYFKQKEAEKERRRGMKPKKEKDTDDLS